MHHLTFRGEHSGQRDVQEAINFHAFEQIILHNHHQFNIIWILAMAFLL